jgi:hypothetical protein
MPRGWDTPESVQARRKVATAMSLQTYRLERQLPAIRDGAAERLGDARVALGAWQMAMKIAEFGHGVVDQYRQRRYAATAALVRTLFEEVTLLAWVAAPDDAEAQLRRMTRVALVVFREAKARGAALPSDAARLLRETTGSAAKKPPSFRDQLKQLDAKEAKAPDGKLFWETHAAHYDLLSDVVHPGFLGPEFSDPMTHELLGFEALAYGHQYLVIGTVSAVRLADQNALADSAQAAYERVHGVQDAELRRLIKP